MQFAVLMGFVLAALAPLMQRWFADRISLVLALFPALIAAWLFSRAPTIINDGPLLMEWQWVPSFRYQPHLYAGWVVLTVRLVNQRYWRVRVGVCGELLKRPPGDRPVSYALMAFMVSMLGLVLADGLITLFIFWELTSVTSYLLIGFNHTDMQARKSARQGLFVTFAGGLALMAGLILLGIASDQWSLTDISAMETDLREHALIRPMLICLLLGAFTKSAQFPFHFWLPNAMAAPTPVWLICTPPPW